MPEKNHFTQVNWHSVSTYGEKYPKISWFELDTRGEVKFNFLNNGG
jgi:hypothetical protein